MGMPSNEGKSVQLESMGISPDHATYHIAGLPVHVFGLEKVHSRDVTVLFFLHGRLGKWEDGTKFINQMLHSVKSNDKSLVVVTFDQRK